MKVTFSDSFWKSVKRLNRHQTWWYKTYEAIRYKIPLFLKNIWFFRKQLWEFRGWDYSFNLDLLSRSLEKTLLVLKDGQEEETSRQKKVDKIERVIHLINRIRSDEYVYDAEKILGELQNPNFFEREDTPEERKHNKSVFELAQKMGEDEWNELWTILRGQNREEYKSIMDNASEEVKKNNNLWNNWYDGSDMRGWWD